MYNRRDLSEEALADMLPRVMGTQHPDNVSPVPFGDSPVVTRHQEDKEVLYNIGTLDIRELMIDYERKRGDVTPLWDWIHQCHSCLREKVIGRDFHVTPRIPNGDTERDDPYFWQSMGIFVNSPLVTNKIGFPGIAFGEFIVPDVRDGATVARMEKHIQQRYALQRMQYAEYGDRTPFPLQDDFFIQGIPLLETVETLLDPESVWDGLFEARERMIGRQTFVQRSFIARSDPALKAGMLSALLAARVNLAKGRRYERDHGVRIPQILGIGSAPFRGGLLPDSPTIDRILATYPGIATVTAQSAFRYDNSPEEVVPSIRELDRKVRSGWLARGGIEDPAEEDLQRVGTVVALLKDRYETSFRELMPLLSNIFPFIPSHRERYHDISVSGESRRVGGFPAVRAIKFGAGCYTLGISPGILGMRGWYALDRDQRDLAGRICPEFPFWIARELSWLNEDNLRVLADEHGLRSVAEDVDAARELAAEWSADSAHREITSRVPQALRREEDLGPTVGQAAAKRGFLG
jgi:phosphoenolpyruvate carboxylase